MQNLDLNNNNNNNNNNTWLQKGGLWSVKHVGRGGIKAGYNRKYDQSTL
jgi:hypothetical protein